MNGNAMRFRWVAVLLLAASAHATAEQPPQPTPAPILPKGPLVKKGMLIATAGDSLTCLKYYTKYLELYYTLCHPDLKLRFVQLGLSGETAPEFAARLESDLLPFEPDLLLTLYGMNDTRFRPYSQGAGEAYAKGIRTIVSKLKDRRIGLVIGDVPPADTHYYATTHLEHKRRRFGLQDGQAIEQAFNANLLNLRNIARQCAEENAVPFADVYAYTYRAMAAAKATLGADYPVCGSDGIHAGPAGQLVFTYAFLRILEASGDLGSIGYDFATDKAQAGGGHRVVPAHSAAHTIDIESKRYPFCFVDEQDESLAKGEGSAAGILSFVSFNQEFNRLLFTARNAPAAKIELTWGEQRQVFTREQLEQGVNLAAEFRRTPFHERFAAISELIRDRQQFEVDVMHRISPKFHPDEKQKSMTAHFQEIMAKRQAADASVQAAFVPVRHRLVLRPVDPQR